MPGFRTDASRLPRATPGSRVALGVIAVALAAGLAPAKAGDTASIPAAAARFDGTWQTTLSCQNASGALGYAFRFDSVVKGGVLHGEKGRAGEPGWLALDGPIEIDGSAKLFVDGLVGGAPFAVGQRPAGTRYGYTVEARFTDDRAEGHRVEGRPCSVTWTRER